MRRLGMIMWLLIGGFSGRVLAQNPPKADPGPRPTAPVFLQTAFLFSPQELGAQIGIGALVAETEKHVIRKSGRERVIVKDRILSIAPGFYYQKFLHTNVFLTVDYAFVRRNRSGFYGKFAPFLGISRTFLNSTTYIVDNNGAVTTDKTPGDWRLMAGFTAGIGKRFDTRRPGLLRDVYLTVNVPFLYPNFRSVALKPSLQIGAAFNLNQFRRSFSKTINTIRR